MKKPIGVIAVALVASMSFAGVALADEDDGDGESRIQAPVVVVDEETGLVTIAIPIDGELPECSSDEPGDPEEPDEDAVGGGDDEVGDDDEAVTYGPGDCIEFVIDHPSGKTHHGAVVSTVAKNLHPSMLDGIKKGHIMRVVAKTGKLAGDDDGDGDDGDVVENKKADKDQRKADREQAKADRDQRKADRKAAHEKRKNDRAKSHPNKGNKNG